MEVVELVRDAGCQAAGGCDLGIGGQDILGGIGGLGGHDHVGPASFRDHGSSPDLHVQHRPAGQQTHPGEPVQTLAAQSTLEQASSLWIPVLENAAADPYTRLPVPAAGQPAKGAVAPDHDQIFIQHGQWMVHPVQNCAHVQRHVFLSFTHVAPPRRGPPPRPARPPPGKPMPRHRARASMPRQVPPPPPISRPARTMSCPDPLP